MRYTLNALILFLSFNIYGQKKNIESDLLSDMLTGTLSYDKIIQQADNYLDTASNPSKYFLKEYGRWDIFWNPRMDAKGSDQTYLHVMGQLVKKRQEKNISSTESLCQTGGGNWELSGPFVDYQRSGRVLSVYAHPTQFPDVIYAGTHAAGLWKTEDKGATWSCLTDYLQVPYLGITDIVGHPIDPNTIYIATGSKHRWGIGVLKSTDAGASFDFTGLTWDAVFGEAIHDLEMNPYKPDIIFASGSNALYRTLDGGDTWTSVLSDREYTPPECITSSTLPNLYNIVEAEMLPENPDVIFTSMYNDYDEGSCNVLPILKTTTDGGNTWTELSLPNLNATSDIRRVFITTSAAQDESLFVLYDDDHSSERSLYQYNYIDDTWQILKRLNFDGLNNQGSGNTFPAFEVNNADANIMYFGGTQMTKLTNALSSNPNSTETLSTITGYHTDVNTVNHADVRGIHIVASEDNGVGDKMIIGTDGGISITKSTPDIIINADNDWIDINNTDGIISANELCITEFFDMDVPNDKSGFWAGGTQDNGTFIYDADSTPKWKEVLAGDGGSTLIDWSNSDVIYARSNPTLNKSINGGLSYNLSKYIPRQDPNNTCTSTFPTETFRNFFMEQHPTDPNILFVANKFIFRRYDSNLNPFPNCSADFSGTPITCFGISPSSPNVIYLAQNNRVLRSVDGGLTWTQLTVSGNSTFPHNLKKILVHPTDSNRFWVAFASFDYVPPVPNHSNARRRIADIDCTTNDCVLTDLSYNNGLPPIPANTIVRDETANIMYCGTDVGVYKYDLNNPSAGWECFNKGMPPCLIFDLEINQYEGRLYAATHGRGIYSTDINEFTDICDVENKPNNEEKATQNMKQITIKNFPNPFTRNSTIEFTLKNADSVTLFVSDVMGRQIEMLVDSEEKNAGTYKVNFDGSIYASGIYYYTIQAHSYVKTQKMILMK